MQVVGPLVCTIPDHWRLMPYFLDRIENFCAKYPTDLVGETVREFVVAAFRSKTPTAMGAVVLVDDDGAVIGHALTTVELRGRERVAFVVQYEVDRPVPVAIRTQLMQTLRTWAAQQPSVIALEAITWLPTKVLERYGFSAYRTIMRAPLEQS